jgi:hypothetical protein
LRKLEPASSPPTVASFGVALLEYFKSNRFLWITKETNWRKSKIASEAETSSKDVKNMTTQNGKICFSFSSNYRHFT